MNKLPLPLVSFTESFDATVEGMQDALLQSLIKSRRAEMMAADAAMVSLARAHRFSEVPTDEGLPSIQSKHLIDLYDLGMVSRVAGRRIYDLLFASIPDGRCAYCRQRPVAQLDHFLPKARYSILSVSPVNLLPVCEGCNKSKLSLVASDASQVILNPYFDDLDGCTWLEADIMPGSHGTVRFKISPDVDLPEVFKQRIRYTFGVLGLGRLYSVAAAAELSNIRGELSEVHADEGIGGVLRHLRRRRRSAERVSLNSWTAAAYRAWEGDLTFHAQGWVLQ